MWQLSWLCLTVFSVYRNKISIVNGIYKSKTLKDDKKRKLNTSTPHFHSIWENSYIQLRLIQYKTSKVTLGKLDWSHLISWSCPVHQKELRWSWWQWQAFLDGSQSQKTPFDILTKMKWRLFEFQFFWPVKACIVFLRL